MERNAVSEMDDNCSVVTNTTNHSNSPCTPKNHIEQLKRLFMDQTSQYTDCEFSPVLPIQGISKVTMLIQPSQNKELTVGDEGSQHSGQSVPIIPLFETNNTIPNQQNDSIEVNNYSQSLLPQELPSQSLLPQEPLRSAIQAPADDQDAGSDITMAESMSLLPQEPTNSFVYVHSSVRTRPVTLLDQTQGTEMTPTLSQSLLPSNSMVHNSVKARPLKMSESSELDKSTFAKTQSISHIDNIGSETTTADSQCLLDPPALRYISSQFKYPDNTAVSQPAMSNGKICSDKIVSTPSDQMMASGESSLSRGLCMSSESKGSNCPQINRDADYLGLQNGDETRNSKSKNKHVMFHEVEQRETSKNDQRNTSQSCEWFPASQGQTTTQQSMLLSQGKKTFYQSWISSTQGEINSAQREVMSSQGEVTASQDWVPSSQGELTASQSNKGDSADRLRSRLGKLVSALDKVPHRQMLVMEATVIQCISSLQDSLHNKLRKHSRNHENLGTMKSLLQTTQESLSKLTALHKTEKLRLAHSAQTCQPNSASDGGTGRKPGDIDFLERQRKVFSLLKRQKLLLEQLKKAKSGQQTNRSIDNENSDRIHESTRITELGATQSKFPLDSKTTKDRGKKRRQQHHRGLQPGINKACTNNRKDSGITIIIEENDDASCSYQGGVTEIERSQTSTRKRKHAFENKAKQSNSCVTSANHVVQSVNPFGSTLTTAEKDMLKPVVKGSGFNKLSSFVYELTELSQEFSTQKTVPETQEAVNKQDNADTKQELIENSQGIAIFTQNSVNNTQDTIRTSGRDLFSDKDIDDKVNDCRDDPKVKETLINSIGSVVRQQKELNEDVDHEIMKTCSGKPFFDSPEDVVIKEKRKIQGLDQMKVLREGAKTVIEPNSGLRVADDDIKENGEDKEKIYSGVNLELENKGNESVKMIGKTTQEEEDSLIDIPVPKLNLTLPDLDSQADDDVGDDECANDGDDNGNRDVSHEVPIVDNEQLEELFSQPEAAGKQHSIVPIETIGEQTTPMNSVHMEIKDGTKVPIEDRISNDDKESNGKNDKLLKSRKNEFQAKSEVPWLNLFRNTDEQKPKSGGTLVTEKQKIIESSAAFMSGDFLVATKVVEVKQNVNKSIDKSFPANKNDPKPGTFDLSKSNLTLSDPYIQGADGINRHFYLKDTALTHSGVVNATNQKSDDTILKSPPLKKSKGDAQELMSPPNVQIPGETWENVSPTATSMSSDVFIVKAKELERRMKRRAQLAQENVICNLNTREPLPSNASVLTVEGNKKTSDLPLAQGMSSSGNGVNKRALNNKPVNIDGKLVQSNNRDSEYSKDKILESIDSVIQHSRKMAEQQERSKGNQSTTKNNIPGQKSYTMTPPACASGSNQKPILASNPAVSQQQLQLSQVQCSMAILGFQAPALNKSSLLSKNLPPRTIVLPKTDIFTKQNSTDNKMNRRVSEDKRMYNMKTSTVKQDISDACASSDDKEVMPATSVPIVPEAGVLPSLKRLIQEGKLQPGRNSLSVTTKGRTYHATLTSQGKIRTGDGLTFVNPSQWLSSLSDGIVVKKKRSFQMVHYKSHPLVHYCAMQTPAWPNVNPTSGIPQKLCAQDRATQVDGFPANENTRPHSLSSTAQDQSIQVEIHASSMSTGQSSTFTSTQDQAIQADSSLAEKSQRTSFNNRGVQWLNERLSTCVVRLLKDSDFVPNDDLPRGFWTDDYSKVKLPMAIWQAVDCW